MASRSPAPSRAGPGLSPAPIWNMRPSGEAVRGGDRCPRYRTGMLSTDADGCRSGSPLSLNRGRWMVSRTARRERRYRVPGCIVLGMGFILETRRGSAWIKQIEGMRSAVPVSYGEDLNSRPDLQRPRWVIDFNDTIGRGGEGVRYSVSACAGTSEAGACTRKPTDVCAKLRGGFSASTPRLCGRRSQGLDEVLVIAPVSKTVMPVRVPTGQVFSHEVIVFATDSFADQAVLSSSSASDVGDQVRLDDADRSELFAI